MVVFVAQRQEYCFLPIGTSCLVPIIKENVVVKLNCYLSMILTCSTLFLGSIRLFSAPVPTDWSTDDLKGNVKSIDAFQTTYTLKFGKWIEGSRSKESTKTYTKDGYLLTTVYYGAGGKPVSKYTWESPNGDVVKGSYLEFVHNKPVVVNRYVLIYDALGRQVQEETYNADGKILSKQIANDWSKYTWRRNGGKDEAYDEYNYNIPIHVKDTATPVDKYIWNRIDYDAEGKKVRGEEFWYDDNGRMMQWRSRHYRFQQGDTTIQYQRDDSGFVVSKKMYFDFKGRGYDYTYDAHGYLNRQEYYRITNDNPRVLESITEWDYEYDKNGNWIKFTEYTLTEQFGTTQRIPQNTTYRTIKYY